MTCSDVARCIETANRWVLNHFSQRAGASISDAELRLFLFWILICRPASSDGGIPPSTDDVVRLGRTYQLTPHRLRAAATSIASTMAYKIASRIETLGQALTIPIDGSASSRDCKVLLAELAREFQDQRHVARRELLLQLLHQADYASIAARAEFWADFVGYDVDLAAVLCGEIAFDGESYSSLLELLLYRYVSECDVDRLCPLLRTAKYLRLDGSDGYRRGISFVCAHCFANGGISSHGAALHLAKKNRDAELDAETQVVLRTTISALLTLVESQRAEPIFFARPLLSRAARHDAKQRPNAAEIDAASPSYSSRTIGKDMAAALAKAEVRALAWVERSVGNFDPFSYSDSNKFEFAVKMLAELLVVCAAYQSLPERGTRRIVNAIQTYIVDHVFKRPELQSFLLQHLSTLPGISLFASLLECGYRDTDFHRKLERLSLQSNIVFGEYAPAVFMDIVHSILRCQLPWPGPSIMSLFERSLLASKPDLLGLKDPDYYAITHAVFFVTDFGRSPENLPQEVKAYFLREANKIMFSFASRNHWDLLGEMLLCHAYLKTIDTPEFATYLQLLLAVQNADGSFTSDVEAKKPGDGSDKQWADHVEKYHTTLIFLLLSAALTTSTHAPAALRPA
jgi:hypothetical protein